MRKKGITAKTVESRNALIAAIVEAGLVGSPLGKVKRLLADSPDSVSKQCNFFTALDLAIMQCNNDLIKVVIEDGVYNPLSGITMEDMDRALLLSEAVGDREAQGLISEAYDIVSKRLSSDGERPSPIAPGGSFY